MVSSLNSADAKQFDVKPFKIDLSSKIPHLKGLVSDTRLPAKPLYPEYEYSGPDRGINLDVLSSLKEEWITTYDWDAEQAKMNEFEHFTAVIEESMEPDAIPVILLHGWPGSFHEFMPVIKPLTQAGTNAAGKKVSYDVVVPSLPGFIFSSLPPANWTTDDVARIFNTLMTDVLGYPKYAVHGTDWGCVVGYSLYSKFAAAVAAAQFVFIPFIPPSPEQMAAENVTLTAEQDETVARFNAAGTTGLGFRDMQTYKPNDVGLALYDNPVGQLAWMGGNIMRWSDPHAGTPPSRLDSTAILTMVSLYYLSESFHTSLWIYGANSTAFSPLYTRAATDAPMLYSEYKNNVACWPREFVAKVGNLVSYIAHDFGGHFPGLDNPPALIADIREIVSYWNV